MLRLLCIFGLLLTLAHAGTAVAGEYADTVNECTAGGFDTASLDDCIALLPSCIALGPPDGAYISLGELGSITLSFSDRIIVDGPGDDLIVWSTGNAPAEPGRIFASSDGINYFALGDYTEAVKSTGFDLEIANLAFASMIRIDDLEGGTWPPGYAFDVDALEAIHTDGAVQASSSTWGQLKAFYR